MTVAESIVVDAARARVLVYVDGGRLQYRAIDQLPDELRARIAEHRAAILRTLAGDSVDRSTLNPEDSGLLASVDTPDTPHYTPDELRELNAAGMTPADVPPIVNRAREIFNGTLADVAPPRRRAARLIREARRHDRGEAIALRDAWRERVAICWADGIDGSTAARVALAELVVSHTEGR